MIKYPVPLGEPPKARGMREVDSQVSVQFLLSLVRDPSFVSAYSWVKRESVYERTNTQRKCPTGFFKKAKVSNPPKQKTNKNYTVLQRHYLIALS